MAADRSVRKDAGLSRWRRRLKCRLGLHSPLVNLTPWVAEAVVSKVQREVLGCGFCGRLTIGRTIPRLEDNNE